MHGRGCLRRRFSPCGLRPASINVSTIERRLGFGPLHTATIARARFPAQPGLASRPRGADFAPRPWGAAFAPRPERAAFPARPRETAVTPWSGPPRTEFPGWSAPRTARRLTGFARRRTASFADPLPPP